MRKYTQKELKRLVSLGLAENITNLSFEDAQKFHREHNYSQVGYSRGQTIAKTALLPIRNGGKRMLPAYKETYTSYTSTSGNTQMYIYRRKKRLSERKKKLIQQKLLGLTLIVVGIVGCFIMPEDNGGFFFASLLGVLRIALN